MTFSLNSTGRECARIKLRPLFETDPVSCSKLGGFPYLPVGAEPPVGADGQPMKLMAQLNFEELPPISDIPFPSEGIVQFWFSESSFWGLSFGESEPHDVFRCVFYSSATQPSRNDARLFEAALDANNPPPFSSPQRCLFEKTVSFWTGCDETFAPDLTDEQMEEVYDANSWGSRVGGWASFTQSDPRPEAPDGDAWILLWQSDSNDDEAVMWGDCGIANAFILRSDLEARRFERVMWNWDCC